MPTQFTHLKYKLKRFITDTLDDETRVNLCSIPSDERIEQQVMLILSQRQH